MDLDSKLIFEAYSQAKSKILTEAPIEMSGDITTEPITQKTMPGQGKAYGAGAIAKIAVATKKTEEQIGEDMANFIKGHPELTKKLIDNKEQLYYPGDPQTFINELVQGRKDYPSFTQKFGVVRSQAGFTINYVLNYLLGAKKTKGGLVMDAARKKEVKAAKAAAAPKTETVFEIDKAVKLENKALRPIVMSLPDDDVPEKEILGVLKTAINEYNDRPGIEPLKIKSFDLFDILKTAGVIKEKQVEKKAKEGEGSGEVETIDEYPEGDDVHMAAKELFNIRSTPGDPNYGDFS